jgi:hypothetical protein
MVQALCFLNNQGYSHFLLLHGNDGYANTPQCYVIRTLPFLYSFLILSID